MSGDFLLSRLPGTLAVAAGRLYALTRVILTQLWSKTLWSQLKPQLWHPLCNHFSLSKEIAKNKTQYLPGGSR
jgi:hypothetical protein